MTFETGYEPHSTLKPVAQDIWVVDGPATIYRKVPVPTRATIVRLENEDLWVHAPTGLSDPLRSELSELGKVRHLIAPRVVPSEEINEWLTTFPDAQHWRVSSGADPSESFRALGEKSDRLWRGQITQILVEGRSGFVEPVFYHHGSGSMIVADFIHRMDTAKLPVRFRPLVWIAGTDYPTGRMPPGVLKHYHRRDNELVDRIDDMLDLMPKRIIVSHGTSYDQDAVAALRWAFRKQIRDRNMGRLLKAQRGQ